jgi:rubrerythrin
MKSFKHILNEGHDIKGCTDSQLLRKGMVEELKAINLYEKIAAEAQDARVREMFLDIAQEERVHAHEFEELLERLDTKWEVAEEDAEKEVEDLIGPEIEEED